MERKEVSPLTLTRKRSMVEEVILSEEELTKEVEVEEEADNLTLDATHAISWGISHLSV